jgi:hypothetical protein
MKHCLILVCLLLCGCARPGAPNASTAQRRLTARAFNSGFPLGHDSYNGVTCASDGKIYYVLCTEKPDVGAQMYAYDPAAGRIAHLGDLTEACGEKGSGAICQGKSHVNFIEAHGKLYFATHIGYYTPGSGGRDVMGVPPPGMKPYPGGHFLSYDMRTGKFENLAINPNRDGIISMTMDTRRGRLYGLTWPTGHLLRFDLAKKELRDLGPIPGQSPERPVYRAICRAPIVDPEDGSLYFTTVDGLIVRYSYDRDVLEPIQGEDMKKDYFGSYDPDQPGHMGYNWRQVVWYPPERMIYGVHGNSGYLFRFDPRVPHIEVLDRITSLPSQRSGMYDQFSFGYLGFTLGPDGHTLYYLTGGPIYVNGKRLAGKATTAKGEAKGLENLHLVTYDIPASKYADHGPVFYEDGQPPTYVNTIAVGKDGAVYAIARVPEGGRMRGDLIRIPPVLGNN